MLKVFAGVLLVGLISALYLSRILRSAMITTDLKTLQESWKKNLDALPATPDKIPTFFFGHGSPLLAMPPSSSGGDMRSWAGSGGPLSAFLKARIIQKPLCFN